MTLITFVDRCEGEIVISDLSDLHHHEGVVRVRPVGVRVDTTRHQARAGQLSTSHGHGPRLTKTWQHHRSYMADVKNKQLTYSSIISSRKSSHCNDGKNSKHIELHKLY